MDYEVPQMPDYEGENKAYWAKKHKDFFMYLVLMRIICIGLVAFFLYFSQHGWSLNAPGAPWHNGARGALSVFIPEFLFVWLLGEIMWKYVANKS